MDLHSVLARNDALQSAVVDRDLVFLNAARDNYVGLDEIGRRIWEMLERPRPVSELVSELRMEFDGSEEKVGSDLLAFLSELQAEGMIHVLEDRPA